MASSNEYVITLIDNTSSGSDSAVAGSSTPSAGTTAQNADNGGLLSKEGARSFGQFMVAYHGLKAFAVQQLNHEVSLVELRTGSREMQERANFQNQLFQKGVGILETTATGALVGGLYGALIGLGLSATHTAIDYVNKQDSINTARQVESVSLEMQRIRAGALGSRSANQ